MSTTTTITTTTETPPQPVPPTEKIIVDIDHFCKIQTVDDVKMPYLD